LGLRALLIIHDVVGSGFLDWISGANHQKPCHCQTFLSALPVFSLSAVLLQLPEAVVLNERMSGLRIFDLLPVDIQTLFIDVVPAKTRQDFAITLIFNLLSKHAFYCFVVADSIALMQPTIGVAIKRGVSNINRFLFSGCLWNGDLNH